MAMIVSTAVDNLDNVVAKNFKPGSRVEMYLGIPRELTAEELTSYQQSLEANGAKLMAPVEIGDYGNQPHVLKVALQAPSYSGVGVLPLVVLLVLALGVVGIAAYTGVTIVNVIKQNMVPLAVIGGVMFLGALLIMSKKPTSTSLQAGSFKASYGTS